MKRCLFTLLLALLLPVNSFAMGVDDPLLTMVEIEKLEILDAHDKPIILEASAWIGKDLHKFYIKTEIERESGETEEAELQFLYSHAIFPFWDIQVGWRHDFEPTPERDWFAIGMQGLAPYLFEVDAVLYFGESGRLGIRLDAEYEYMFTQRWILSPEIEINAYSKKDSATGVGSGVSDLTAGLRLHYEIRREFSPYIGINWTKQFGETARFTNSMGEDSTDSQMVLGIRLWF